MPLDNELEKDENWHLAIAGIASLLLHVLLLAFLLRPAAAYTEERIQIRVLPEVKTLVPPPPVTVQKQIVSPSEAPSEPPKPETRFKSERDMRAEKESIKRGEDVQKSNPSPPVKKAQPEATAKRSVEPEPPTVTPKREKSRGPATLKLSESEVLETIEHAPATKMKAGADRVREQKFQSREPFKQSMNASLFQGVTGSSDYLPDIPDGDITLLNAKADRFAVFVRRVSHQVFGALRQLNWQNLSPAELRKLQNFSTIEAVMDPTGKLLRVSVQDSSGSQIFDQSTKRAAEKGAWDQNPPQDAIADDGNIHFIFKSRSWSRVMPNGRGEQRWLLLGTGLL